MTEEKHDRTNQAKLATRIGQILDQKKARNIEQIGVENKTVLADYLVIATATNKTHIKGLADEVEYKLKKELDLEPHHVEGEESRRWILLDYGDVIVNLFLAEEREFYKLEKLWKARPNSQSQSQNNSIDDR